MLVLFRITESCGGVCVCGVRACVHLQCTASILSLSLSPPPTLPLSPLFPSLHSIEKIVNVRSKVLVIHGTDDDVIDFRHGLAIHDRAPNTVEPLWVEGAGHNDVELFRPYLDRLRKFINEEIGPAADAS